MATSKKPTRTATRRSPVHTTVVTAAAIDALFVDEPEDLDALRRALADVDPDAARRRLIERLRDPATERWQAAMTAAALGLLGVSPVCAELTAILGDRALSDHARYAAIVALQSLESEQLTAIIPTLSEAASEALLVLPMFEMVAAVQEDPDDARDVAEALATLDPEVRLAWLMSLGQARRRIGVRAADLYRYALADRTIAGDDRLREPMLLALVEEADEAGSALLQELRARAPKALRAPFQVALLKLETARANGGAKGADAGVEAFASNPDGQGAIVVFMSFRNPDGSFTLANLCLRLTEDLRNGFVEPRATRAERDRRTGEFSDDGSIVLIPAPPGEVARLVEDAAARTLKLRGAVPGDVRRAVELFARVPSVDLPPPVPGRSLVMSTLPTLCGRPLFRSWFYDDDDLARFGATSLRGPSGELSAAGLLALARSPMRARVVAMARYMSRWTTWRGDAGEAADWTTLADGAERDFALSPLAVAMASLTLNPEAFDLPPRPGGARGRVDAPVGMEPFAERFPEVAADERRVIVLKGHRGIPDDAYELHEFYCAERGCECNRVLLKAVARSTGADVATIGHGFDARAAEFAADLPRTYLDPLHARAPFAEALLDVVESALATDAPWHRRLEGHYQMVKQAVALAPVRRAGPKIGPNERCPCGSGKKYKKCHGGR